MASPFPAIHCWPTLARSLSIRALFLCLPALPVAAEETVPRPPAKPPVANSFGPAVDWRLTARIKEELRYDSNRTLDNPSEGAIYGSDTTVGLKLDAETERTFLSLSAGFDGGIFGGPGDTDQLNRLDPNVAASMRYTGKDYQVDTLFNIDVKPTSVTQLDDTGILDDETSQITANFDTVYTQSLNARNQLSTGANARAIRFVDQVDGLEETNTFGVFSNWRHQLNLATALNFRGGARYFSANDTEETRSQTIDLTVGVEHDRTARHSFGASGGVTFVRQTRDGLPGGGTPDFFTGFNGGASFDYRLSRLNAGIDLSHSIDPSSDGELQAFTRLSGDIGYRLTQRSTISGLLSYSHRGDISGEDSDNDTRQVITLGPTFTHRITENLDLGLNYRFRLSDDNDQDMATGHQVFLTLSRDLTLLP
ncbi:hypothetical protein KHP62_20230 [Rhodobacteraceae bacterium NNCM2]|nr:hypothetical protein [Coraliihabitans acroporae]